MAAPIRFLSGRQQQQKIGIEGSTEDKKVLEVVGRTGIGTTSFEPSKILDVRGDAIVEGTATVGKLEITGTGDVPASLTVETANVTGVSTFGGAVDVNAGLDVDGQADLDEVVVAGVATFSNAVDINSTLDVDGDTQLDDLTVAGVATFSSAINATDIIKGYEYTAAPFGSTVTLAVTVASKDSTHRYNGTGSSNAYVIDGIQSPFLTLTPGRTYRFTNDNTGSHPFRFYLEADKTTQYDTNVNFQDTYTEITITDETPTVLHYQCSSHPFMGNAIQTNANVVNTNYPATIRSTLNVTGVSTFPQLDVSTGGLDVDGLTNLDEVVVAGVSTFTGNIVAVSAEFSGNVTIAGTLTAEDKTNIDSLGIVTARTGVRVDAGGLIVTSGVSTFTDSVDIDNGVGVVGGLTADSLTISGVTTGINAAGISSFVRIDVDGQADLDEVVVAGVATFQGAVNFDVNSEINIGTGVTILGNNLHVTGIVSAAQFIGDGSGITNLPGISTQGSSNLTDVNVSGTTTTAQLRVSGIGTAEKFFVSTGGFEVDGQSDLDELVVAGVSTFNANTNVVGDLSVTGDIGASGIITATGINLVAGSGLDVGAIGVLTALSVDVSTGGIDVDGQATLDEVVVAGVATFSALADVNNRLDVVGGANIDQVNVTGIASFAQLDVSTGGIDVDGQATLDELIVAGVSTFSAKAVFNTAYPSIDADNEIQVGTAIQLGKAGVITATSFVGSGANLTGVGTQGTDIQARSIVIAGVSTFNNTVSLPDDTSLILGDDDDFELHHIAGGNSYIKNNAAALEIRSDATTINSKNNAVTFLKANASGLMATTGIVTATQLDVSTGGLDVDGQTDLDELQVAGVSTFSSAVDINAGLDVDGQTDLDELQVAGVSTFSANVNLGDSNKAIFGDGDDLQIYHDGSNSAIQNTTGYLYLYGGTNNIYLRAKNDEDGIVIKPNDSVELYHDNSKKFETTGTGAIVTGVLTATSFSGDGSALTGIAATDHVSTFDLVVAGVSTFNEDIQLRAGKDLLLFDSNEQSTGRITTGAVGQEALSISATKGRLSLTCQSTTGANAGRVRITSHSSQYIENVVGNTTRLQINGSGIDVTGIVTATSFSGDGSALTGIGTAHVSTFDLVVAGVSTFNEDIKLRDGKDIFFFDSSEQSTGRIFAGSPDGIYMSATRGILNFSNQSTTGTNAGQIKLNCHSSNSIEQQVGGTTKLQVNGSGIDVTGIVTATQLDVSTGGLDVDGETQLDELVVAGIATFQTHVELGDDDELRLGTGDDLRIYHDGSNSYIHNDTGNLRIEIDSSSGGDIQIINNNTTAISDHSFNYQAKFIDGGAVELYHNTNKRFETTADGADFSGTGSIKVPVGTTAQRNSSPTAGDFRYNSTEGAFEGYTDSWGSIGGAGGAEEVDTNVSSTSAVGVGSFATASFRSAEVIAQIVQIDEYQVGKYLMIHDGTTVTVIEQTAVATGDAMLGSFDGAINGSNVELRVNMVSSGIATVTTKISTVTI